MIPKTANIITNFLLKNEIIPTEETEVYQYSLEMIVSSVFNFIIAVILGILFHNLLFSILFFTILATVRIHCGGFHASSYVKCNLTYIVVYLCVLLLHSFFMSNSPTDTVILMGDVFAVLFMYLYAPVESEQRALTKSETAVEKKVSIRRTCLWNLAGILCWIFNAKEITYLILITLLMLAGMMGVEIVSKRNHPVQIDT